MLVWVGGERIFTGDAWNNVATKTWANLSAGTWHDVLNPVTNVAPGASIDHNTDGRSTAMFTIIDVGANHHFEKGQVVEIRDMTGDTVFGGLIEEVTEQLITTPSDPILTHDVQAADYTRLADRRLFVGAYEEGVAGDIVRDILDVLAEDGITEGTIQDGTLLERQLFPYTTCSEALDRLAELCGFIWFVDYDKKLYFIDRTTYAAEWTLDDYNDVLEGSVSVSSGNPAYRNVQYITGGAALTDTMTEYFVGDGYTRSFTVGFPIATEPEIYINDVQKSVGIGGVESGQAWYWNKGNNTVTQDSSEQVLSSNDVLKVVYIGRFSLIAKVSQAAQITARRAVEGFGSGKYERIDADPTLADHAAAIEAARGKLLSYAVVGKKITYRTIRPGLAAGVIQHIKLPVHNVDDDCLIISIHVTFGEGPSQYNYIMPIYEVEAVTGPVDKSWEMLFCELADMARKKNDETVTVADAGTVQGLEEFSKTWQPTEHPNPFITVFPDGSTTPASVDFPCLDPNDRLKYVVLYTNGAEFFRTPVTSQTQTTTEIDSICIIQANEANGTPISRVGLWGGDTCSQTVGTGIEMEKHTFVKTKNQLETIQFNFYDLKGW